LSVVETNEAQKRTGTSLESVVEIDMSRGEVPWDAAEEGTEDVLERIADPLLDPRLIEARIMAFSMGKRVDTAKGTTTNTNPTEVVEVDLIP